MVDHHVQNCATIDIKLLKLKNKNVETISKVFVTNRNRIFNDFKTVCGGLLRCLIALYMYFVLAGQVFVREQNSQIFKYLSMEFFSKYMNKINNLKPEHESCA